MTGSIYDSGIYRDLVLDRETAALFTDSAEVRAMMIVEGALAKAQGAVGLIPEVSARAIHRASLELQLDPGGLSAETGRSAVPVPALVAAFREAMQAPEHGAWIHYGATSQDIVDTALALRLRQALAIWEGRLRALAAALGRLAEAHAETPMAARTYGQVATVTSFGAVVAGWGAPLLDLLDELPAVRDGVTRVSLSGAAGTLSAMGDTGPEVRARLAEGLGLSDPGRSWHTDRGGIARLAGWMTRGTGAMGKMGEDLILLTQSGFGEVRLPAAGGSSTMPQKQNPVMPSLLVTLARVGAALEGVVQGAVLHRQQRDGAAWIAEWFVLPQLCLGFGRALQVAQDLAEGVAPDADAMAARIDDGTGLIFAEALSFALAKAMPRPDAQAAVKAMCKDVAAGAGSLPDLARARWPDLDLSSAFDPAAQLGTAPAEARAFAARAAG
ncbi:lyase family protein [Wenxinia marina]|uniref:3-carboxy-cis,cis-muconate cycloisomerase n=1 Tax=Wenxinia marina DSM 24838 TaxID=1123501 RepID=A0A0D0Q8I1_9RHOB|nr:lyase family protein [Wenxinia marina]KIQ70684.1 3-carboxy-cis,cis-muconate cycloisomerase [Wenxinia marina DSM 24838]GGL51352.1 3-carboxy-cis,cis-muconate cycloisomerase [Wenxinia marina]